MTQVPPLPASPTDHEPVFQEPWEARAFAIVVLLHERGLYTWREWADALAARIATDKAAGDDVTDSYYRCWLAALEDLLAIKGIGSMAETARWRDAWQHAVNRTPHGRPIQLQANDFNE